MTRLSIGLLFGLLLIPAKDPWWNGWAVFIPFAAIFFFFSLREKFGFILSSTILWTLFSGIRIFTDRNLYQEYGPQIAMGIDNTALQATMAFLLVILFMKACKNYHEWIEEILAALCLADSVVVLLQAITNHAPSGFMGNASINGTFIAITYCFLVFKREKSPHSVLPIGLVFKRHSIRALWDIICVLLPIGALYASRSSVPIGVLVIVWFFYFLINGGDIKGLDSLKRRILMAGFSVLMIFALAWYFTPSLFGDSGRFGIWKICFQWWVDHSNIWLGTGLGTFFMFGPHIQVERHFATSEWWIWAHNDWFQALFETGLIGLGLYVSLFLQSLTKALRSEKPHLAIALLGYGSSAFFNFNGHVVLTALLGAFLIARIHGDE